MVLGWQAQLTSYIRETIPSVLRDSSVGELSANLRHLTRELQDKHGYDAIAQIGIQYRTDIYGYHKSCQPFIVVYLNDSEDPLMKHKIASSFHNCSLPSLQSYDSLNCYNVHIQTRQQFLRWLDVSIGGLQYIPVKLEDTSKTIIANRPIVLSATTVRALNWMSSPVFDYVHGVMRGNDMRTVLMADRIQCALCQHFNCDTSGHFSAKPSAFPPPLLRGVNELWQQSPVTPSDFAPLLHSRESNIERVKRVFQLEIGWRTRFDQYKKLMDECNRECWSNVESAIQVEGATDNSNIYVPSHSMHLSDIEELVKSHIPNSDVVSDLVRSKLAIKTEEPNVVNDGIFLGNRFMYQPVPPICPHDEVMAAAKVVKVEKTANGGVDIDFEFPCATTMVGKTTTNPLFPILRVLETKFRSSEGVVESPGSALFMHLIGSIPESLMETKPTRYLERFTPEICRPCVMIWMCREELGIIRIALDELKDSVHLSIRHFMSSLQQPKHRLPPNVTTVKDDRSFHLACIKLIRRMNPDWIFSVDHDLYGIGFLIDSAANLGWSADDYRNSLGRRSQHKTPEEILTTKQQLISNRRTTPRMFKRGFMKSIASTAWIPKLEYLTNQPLASFADSREAKSRGFNRRNDTSVLPRGQTRLEYYAEAADLLKAYHSEIGDTGDHSESDIEEKANHPVTARGRTNRYQRNVHLHGRSCQSLLSSVKSSKRGPHNFHGGVAFGDLKISLPLLSPLELTILYRSDETSNQQALIQYLVMLIRAMEEVELKAELRAFAYESSRVLGTDAGSIFSRGSQYSVECCLYASAERRGFILLTAAKEAVRDQRSLEAIPMVVSPSIGLCMHPVLVFDFFSMYPSIISALNICYSTCLGNNDMTCGPIGVVKEYSPVRQSSASLPLIRTSNGSLFVPHGERLGLLPEFLAEIIQARAKVKRDMKRHRAELLADPSKEQFLRRRIKQGQLRQLSLKMVANVTYGYTAATYSGRMPMPEVADAIVQASRDCLIKVMHYVEHQYEALGLKVIYGDTDSLFVLYPYSSVRMAFALGRRLEKEMTELLNIQGLVLQLEKVYERSIYQTKKRYAGYSYETESSAPVVDIKGLEAIRADQPNIVRLMTSEAITQLLQGTPGKTADSLSNILAKAQPSDFITWHRVRRVPRNFTPSLLSSPSSYLAYKDFKLLTTEPLVCIPRPEAYWGGSYPHLRTVAKDPWTTKLIDRLSTPFLVHPFGQQEVDTKEGGVIDIAGTYRETVAPTIKRLYQLVNLLGMYPSKGKLETLLKMLTSPIANSAPRKDYQLAIRCAEGSW
eukprot:GHVH01005062.1.p1 GENE.GHVH01005062.1~~GHVH01005062.1.p1  ORF type:complete len:1479 (-),score=202.79 GHVH01005062.1:1060-4968(-)